MPTLLQIEPISGAEMRTIREDFGISQEHWARMLDVSTITIRTWEGLVTGTVRATLAVQGLAERIRQAGVEFIPPNSRVESRKSRTVNSKR